MVRCAAEGGRGLWPIGPAGCGLRHTPPGSGAGRSGDALYHLPVGRVHGASASPRARDLARRVAGQLRRVVGQPCRARPARGGRRCEIRRIAEGSSGASAGTAFEATLLRMTDELFRNSVGERGDVGGARRGLRRAPPDGRGRNGEPLHHAVDDVQRVRYPTRRGEPRSAPGRRAVSGERARAGAAAGEGARRARSRGRPCRQPDPGAASKAQSGPGPTSQLHQPCVEAFAASPGDAHPAHRVGSAAPSTSGRSMSAASDERATTASSRSGSPRAQMPGVGRLRADDPACRGRVVPDTGDLRRDVGGPRGALRHRASDERRVHRELLSGHVNGAQRASACSSTPATNGFRSFRPADRVVTGEHHMRTPPSPRLYRCLLGSVEAQTHSAASTDRSPDAVGRSGSARCLDRLDADAPREARSACRQGVSHRGRGGGHGEASD